VSASDKSLSQKRIHEANPLVRESVLNGGGSLLRAGLALVAGAFNRRAAGGTRCIGGQSRGRLSAPNLPEGWFAGLTDYSWTFNWRTSASDAPLVPLGIQVGKVVRIGKQPVSLSVEAARAAWKPESGPDPGWIIGF
jgi:hypothetical protein